MQNDLREGSGKLLSYLAHNTAAVQSRLRLWFILAGLQTVVLQQLGPDAAPSTLEALATLEHLQSLDMP